MAESLVATGMVMTTVEAEELDFSFVFQLQKKC